MCFFLLAYVGSSCFASTTSVIELQTDDRGLFELQRILLPGMPMGRPVSEMRRLIEERLTRTIRESEPVTKQYWNSPFRALELCLWKFALEELNDQDKGTLYHRSHICRVY